MMKDNLVALAVNGAIVQHVLCRKVAKQFFMQLLVGKEIQTCRMGFVLRRFLAALILLSAFDSLVVAIIIISNLPRTLLTGDASFLVWPTVVVCRSKTRKWKEYQRKY